MSALSLTMRRIARDAARASLRARAETATSVTAVGRRRPFTDHSGEREPPSRGFVLPAGSCEPRMSFGWATSSLARAPGTRRGVHASARARATDPALADARGIEEDHERPSSQYDFANKPSRGINQWKRARKKAAFIKANATTRRENTTARAEERQTKRLERWRAIAATQRAWNSAKRDRASVVETAPPPPVSESAE